eukprot:gene19920-biopygen10070
MARACRGLYAFFGFGAGVARAYYYWGTWGHSCETKCGAACAGQSEKKTAPKAQPFLFGSCSQIREEQEHASGHGSGYY